MIEINFFLRQLIQSIKPGNARKLPKYMPPPPNGCDPFSAGEELLMLRRNSSPGLLDALMIPLVVGVTGALLEKRGVGTGSVFGIALALVVTGALAKKIILATLRKSRADAELAPDDLRKTEPCSPDAPPTPTSKQQPPAKQADHAVVG
jgi:hypothetical protein